jgi:hypothetical protein
MVHSKMWRFLCWPQLAHFLHTVHAQGPGWLSVPGGPWPSRDPGKGSGQLCHRAHAQDLLAQWKGPVCVFITCMYECMYHMNVCITCMFECMYHMYVWMYGVCVWRGGCACDACTCGWIVRCCGYIESELLYWSWCQAIHAWCRMMIDGHARCYTGLGVKQWTGDVEQWYMDKRAAILILVSSNKCMIYGQARCYIDLGVKQ